MNFSGQGLKVLYPVHFYALFFFREGGICRCMSGAASNMARSHSA